MKKWLSTLLCLLLVVAMLFSFAACGEDKDDDDDKESTGASDDKDAPTAAKKKRSMEQAIEAYVNGMATGDAEKILNVLPDAIVDEFIEEYGADSRSELIEMLEDEFDPDTDAVDVKNIDIEETDFEDSYFGSEDEFLTEMEEYYGIDADDVEDVAVVDVTIETDEDDEYETMMLIKMDGNWYVIM